MTERTLADMEVETAYTTEPTPAYANTDLRVVYHVPDPDLVRLEALRTARTARARTTKLPHYAGCAVICIMLAIAWWQFGTSEHKHDPVRAISWHTFVPQPYERVGFVYVLRAGKYAGYYAVKGRVTRNRHGSGSFFFTTSGAMVETTLDWVYVTKRLRNIGHVPRIG